MSTPLSAMNAISWHECPDCHNLFAQQIEQLRAERDAMRDVLVEVRAWRRAAVGLEPFPPTDPETLGARIDAAIAKAEGRSNG